MDLSNPIRTENWPVWVPDAARHYLVHTENGLSIRALARAVPCHPSTILRQVRRFEGRRDDPLVDDALRQLAGRLDDKDKKDTTLMTCEMRHAPVPADELLTQDRIDREAKRVLRRLCEPRAVLAVAMEMETAVVVRDTDEGGSVRTAVVDREIAQAMALKDWITCPEPTGRISRYFITNAGRAALRRLTAADENRAQGFAEARSTLDSDDRDWTFVPTATDGARSRYHVTESPLLALARRRDKDGNAFLDRALVTAGERLREDFELSSSKMRAVKTWDGVMALPKDRSASMSAGAFRAEQRVSAAMAELGPGLGDVVLRCCCMLEGLEVTEKYLGWSARSGKIVLRIALQRLAQHYVDTNGRFAPLIG